jgi:hypothetical protein
VSDQDFFFDEDEAPAEKPAKAGKAQAPVSKAAASPRKRPAAAKTTPKAATPAEDTGTDAVPFAEQTVTVLIAGLLMVISLLVGAIIGFLLGGTSTVPATTGIPEAAAPAGGTGTEPGPLTNEQMQGGMPAGHPAVAQTGTAGATATP